MTVKYILKRCMHNYARVNTWSNNGIVVVAHYIEITEKLFFKCVSVCFLIIILLNIPISLIGTQAKPIN